MSALPTAPVPGPWPDAYEHLRADVLAELARRGLDLSDEAAVKAMVDERVSAYQTRARAGLGGRALADQGAMAARLCRSLLDYGPLSRFVSGEVVAEEIVIVGNDVAYIDAEGRWIMLDEPVTEAELRAVIDRLLAGAGAAVDQANPMVSAQVLDGAGRLGVVIPPVSDCLNATIRWYLPRHETMTDVVGWESITTPAASLLVATGLTPTGRVVTGQPASGKTTLANAMVRAVPGSQRVICCEDTPEIDARHLTPFRWRTRRAGPDGAGEVTLRDLVRHALGMRPDLIVVGEVRDAEAFELTRAGNAGCGMLTTLHANSAKAGLLALVSTALMAGANVEVAQVRAAFCSIVDLVIHCEREPLEDVRPGGRVRRQVMEIAAVPALQGSATEVSTEPIFVRECLGAPLRWTKAPLPAELTERLDRVLRPRGMTCAGILAGKDRLV